MKQSIGTLIILGLSLSLQAQTSMDQANNSTYLKPPAAPQYEVCGYVTVDNGYGGTYQVADQACRDRNAEKQRNYNAAIEVYNRSSRMMSSDASTTTKPVEPTYENCQTNDVENGGYRVDYACQRRNQDKQRDYNIQISAWNKMQQEQAMNNQAAQSEEQRRALAEAQAQSATEALRKAQEQNQKSASRSQKAATITQGISIAFGVSYAATCAAFGGCQTPLLVASIAFGLLSSKSSRQASQNVASGVSACQTQSQLNSSGSGDCSAIANTPTNPTPITSVFDQNGNCIASDKSLCDQVTAGLPPGTNIKDVVKGASQFAMTPPFKTNADGSVTTKDGKTFKPSDFASKEALMAAGLSADEASAAMAAIGKAGLGLPKDGLAGAKEDLKTAASGKKVDFGGGEIGGGSGSDSAAAAGNTSGSLGSKAIGGGLAGGDGRDSKRNPAGAGLTRDFNGEAIGAAGDDIFSMMNRRYKMKTAQDSFISN